MGIKWSYEHPVFVWDENSRPRGWAPDFLRALHDHQLGGESPPSSITLFRRVVKDDPKGLASPIKEGMASLRTVRLLGEGSCRQNHRPKPQYIGEPTW